jgi:hypothetical protein
MKTKNLKLFEKYYNKEMSDTEREQFERNLETDKEMNALFKEYLSIYDAISDKETLDLRRKLIDISRAEEDDNKSRDFLSQGRNWFWIAALMTILICLTAIMYMFFDRIEKREKFIAEVYQGIYAHPGNMERELTKFDQRNVGFQVDAPGDTIFINKQGPIYFQWHLDFEEPLILDFIDQQGKVIYNSGKFITSPFTVKGTFPGGMIVYRFRTEKEFYYMGFMFLK